MIVSYQDRSASFDPRTLAFEPLAALETVSGVGERFGSAAMLYDEAPAFGNQRAHELPARPAQRSWKRGRWLDRLVLNVANHCNLDCVYCYAQGGDYGGPHERMTFEIGRSAFRRFYETYDEISRVMFFGGEPLLNADVIERLCEFGWQTADELGRSRPTYTIITNGTILSPKIVDLIKRYQLKMTVSLDGPPEINDQLRIARSGQPITRRVEENIRILQKETGQPGQIEGTYTRLHVERGIGVADVMDYILDELGIHLLHMPINVLGRSNRHDPLAIRPEDFDLVNSYYSAAVSRSIRDVVKKPVGELCLLSAVVEMVDTLIHPSDHPSTFICPAGTGTIAVDSDGTVYPCFMFYRNSKFRLGSIVRPNAQTLEDVAQKSFVDGLRPEAIPNLARSWAWRFLQGCAGGNYFKNEDHGVVAADEVRFVEAMVSAAVVELAHLKSDDLQWKYLPMALNLFKLFVDAPRE